MRKEILTVAAIIAILMAGTTLGADLIAGNPKNGANVVGEVAVSLENGFIVVTYTVTGDVVLTETHLHIAESPDDIPQNNGNPNPGEFQYSDPHGPVTEWTYTIPLQVDPIYHPKNGKVLDPGHNWTSATTLFIAAHGVVEYSDDCDELVLDFLPDEVTVSVLAAIDPGVDDDSYFDALVSGGTVLDGLYDAWCYSPEKSIRLTPDYPRGTPLQALVFSSYEDGYGNMDLVNWILNNISVGDVSQACYDDAEPPALTKYTYGDIQRAIWELLGYSSTSGLGPWSQCRVDEIIAAAIENGVGYVPNCGDVVAIILQPYAYIPEVPAQFDPVTGDQVEGLWYFQPIIITIPAPCCGGDDTVWAGEPDPTDIVPGPEPDDGDGYKYEFPGDNWAMYFTYTVE
jgi:hypothetical protein